jgi:hypothetical protein
MKTWPGMGSGISGFAERTSQELPSESASIDNAMFAE